MVNDIRQRMASGTYNVSNEDVADKLVDGYFSETI
jgi:anti-sigma28 factor (negative regulator of flagellin synthesis)